MSVYLTGTLITLFLLLSCIFLIVLKKSIQSVPAAKKRLNAVDQDFASLKESFNDDSQFLRFSKLLLFKKELLELTKRLRSTRSIFLRNEIRERLDEILAFEKNLLNKRELVNERFFQKERERAKHIFSENGESLLTDEQIRSVLCDDDRNLIIAGAGSGKTRVIDFKVRYLVNHKKISPSRIILLSFSRKSAADLIKKVSESVPGVEARTIHSFSSQILGNHGKKIFDERSNELESFVIKALVQTLKEASSYKLLLEFYKKYFSDIKPLIFYKNLDELREDLWKNNSKLIASSDRFEEVKAKRALKTLRGEYVRSVDERYIADFLYLQDIDYVYEKKYPHSKESYYPDFYLVEDDVYLEHFAITSDGVPPSYFSKPDKYMEGMKWKRETHERNRTRMIESYSYLLNEGESSAYLTKLLADNGVHVKENLESEQIYGKISRHFCSFFTRFYNAYKLSGFSVDLLKDKYSDPKHLVFLKLFERFLHHFEELVEKENKMDFNDMIIEAAKMHQNNYTGGFDYIIVDEFQDTSNLAMKLLDAVYRNSPNSAFLSVGDDWQSIYGFNGSDVSILAGYQGNYSGVSIQKLNSNFRSHSRIVDLGKLFISKNPSQIPKDVISRNDCFKESEIDFLFFEQMEEKIRAIPDNESVFVLYRYNDDCPVEQGVFREYFTRDKNRKPVRRASCSKNISLMTMHASKGLEARHVFVLFPDGVRRKFPAEVEDHFVFNMLKTHSDDFPFSEERRLMYVAITRAEQNLYFVSSSKSGDPNSVFWDELMELDSLQ